MSGRDEKPQSVKENEDKVAWYDARKDYVRTGIRHETVERGAWRAIERERYENTMTAVNRYYGMVRRENQATRPTRRTKIRAWLGRRKENILNTLVWIWGFFSNRACAGFFIGTLINLIMVILNINLLFQGEINILILPVIVLCIIQIFVFGMLLKKEIDEDYWL